MDLTESNQHGQGIPCFAAGAAAAAPGAIAMRDAQAAAHAADGAARASGSPAIAAASGLADSLRMAAGLVTACGDRTPIVAVAEVLADDIPTALPALKTASRTLIDLTAGGMLDRIPAALVSRAPVAVLVAPGGLADALAGVRAAIEGWTQADSLVDSTGIDPEAATAPFAALRESRRPVIVVGHGAAVSSNPDRIARLARTWQAPVCLTWAATAMPAATLDRFLAAFSADIPILPAGTVPWSTALARADRLLTLGSGLSESDWFGLTEARLVRAPVTAVALDADNDLPAEHTVDAEAGVFADAFADELERGGVLTREGWLERFIEARSTWTELVDQEADRAAGEERLAPALVARELVTAAPADTIFVAEGGASGCWLATYAWLRPLVIPAQHASIGSSIAMAAGAGSAQPQRPIWAVVGDGAFFYGSRELAGMVERQQPIVVFVFNDRSWNAIRIIQTLFFRRRVVGTDLPSVDYSAFAELHGCDHVKVKTAGDLAKALSMAQESRTGPLLVDVQIEKGAIPFVGSNFILAELDGVLRTLAGSAAISSAVAAANDRPALLANLRVIYGAIKK